MPHTNHVYTSLRAYRPITKKSLQANQLISLVRGLLDVLYQPLS